MADFRFNIRNLYLEGNFSSLCPWIFRNSIIQEIKVVSSRFNFKNLSNLTHLNSTISRFSISSKNLSLDNSILEPNVFKNLQELRIQNSILYKINPDTFKELKTRIYRNTNKQF